MKPKSHILDNPHLKNNPFTVPEDYFENNSITLYTHTRSSSQPFSTPDDYFETSALKIKEKVLSSSSSQAFIVPNNYFEHNTNTLSQIVLSTSASSNKKIIRMLPYIAAACIVAITFGIYWYIQTHSISTTSFNDCKTIACLTKKDILSKDNHLIDEYTMEESISDEDLEKHFHTVPSSSSHSNSTTINETF